MIYLIITFESMLLTSRQHLAIEVTNPKSTNPLFYLTTLYKMALLGLLINNAVLEKRFVALPLQFCNVIRFIRNSSIITTYENTLCSCLVEYLKENDLTTFKLDEEESFNLITDILVECEFKRTVEAYNSMLLRKHFKLAKVMY